MVIWKLGEILWGGFDASKVGPEIVPIVKPASMVENNTGDYCKYLKKILSATRTREKRSSKGRSRKCGMAGC